MPKRKFLTTQQLRDQAANGTLGTKSAKYQGINPKERKHEEADLHLAFCKWMKWEHPDIPFVRHEKERKRSFASGNILKAYNNFDGLPDMEVLLTVQSFNLAAIITSDGQIGTIYSGLYIEFKKPGESWHKQDGYIKPEYLHQAKAHRYLWSINRAAYFCNDLDEAKWILHRYLEGKPLPRQEYLFPVEVNL